jgi:hypothetical protein
VWIEKFVLFSYENCENCENPENPENQAHNMCGNHLAFILLLNVDQSEPFECRHIFKNHFNLHFKEKGKPNNCHKCYVPNFNDFYMETI